MVSWLKEIVSGLSLWRDSTVLMFSVKDPSLLYYMQQKMFFRRSFLLYSLCANLEGIKDALCYKFRRPTIGQNCSTVYTNKGGHRDAFLNEWCEAPCVSRGLLIFSRPCATKPQAKREMTVADPGFQEVGFWYALVRKACKIFRSHAHFGAKPHLFRSFLRQTTSPASLIDPFSNEFSSEVF